MPVELHWENEAHTLVHMEFVGRWTWDEAYEGSKLGYTMLESVDHVVNVIIDMSRSTGLPILALTHARNMIAKRHPRTGLTVFIGANELFLTLWRIFANAYRQAAHTQEFTFARNLDEALELFDAREKSAVQPP